MLSINLGEIASTEYTTEDGVSVTRVSTELLQSSPAGEKRRTLFFEVEKSDAEFLCDDRIDAFIVGLLPWAMDKARGKEPITISSTMPMSEKLMFNLTQTYIPTIVKEIPDRYGMVDLRFPTTTTVFESRNHRGVGITGGVDSTYTLLKLSSPPPSFAI